MAKFHFDDSAIVSVKVEVVTKFGTTWVVELDDVEACPGIGSLAVHADSRQPTLELRASGRLNHFVINRHDEEPSDG